MAKRQQKAANRRNQFRAEPPKRIPHRTRADSNSPLYETITEEELAKLRAHCHFQLGDFRRTSALLISDDGQLGSNIYYEDISDTMTISTAHARWLLANPDQMLTYSTKSFSELMSGNVVDPVAAISTVSSAHEKIGSKDTNLNSLLLGPWALSMKHMDGTPEENANKITERLVSLGGWDGKEESKASVVEFWAKQNCVVTFKEVEPFGEIAMIRAVSSTDPHAGLEYIPDTVQTQALSDNESASRRQMFEKAYGATASLSAGGSALIVNEAISDANLPVQKTVHITQEELMLCSFLHGETSDKRLFHLAVEKIAAGNDYVSMVFLNSAEDKSVLYTNIEEADGGYNVTIRMLACAQDLRNHLYRLGFENSEYASEFVVEYGAKELGIKITGVTEDNGVVVGLPKTLTGINGDKGVIVDILPHDQLPKDSSGEVAVLDVTTMIGDREKAMREKELSDMVASLEEISKQAWEKFEKAGGIAKMEDVVAKMEERITEVLAKREPGIKVEVLPMTEEDEQLKGFSWTAKIQLAPQDKEHHDRLVAAGFTPAYKEEGVVLEVLATRKIDEVEPAVTEWYKTTGKDIGQNEMLVYSMVGVIAPSMLNLDKDSPLFVEAAAIAANVVKERSGIVLSESFIAAALRGECLRLETEAGKGDDDAASDERFALPA